MAISSLNPNQKSGGYTQKTTGNFGTTSSSYQTALNITGKSGRLRTVSSWCPTTNTTPFVRITIDGVVVTDVAGLASSTKRYHSPLASNVSYRAIGLFDLPYKNSLLIELKNANNSDQVFVEWTIDE